MKQKSAPEIISTEIIPALGKVGEDFDKGRTYLPGLLMSAEAANAAFAIIRQGVPTGVDMGGKLILATVKGDIHDIGKNIVKLIFESYGYTVIDLGRDVSAEKVLSAVEENPNAILGLSALMTTTLSAMADTVEAVKRKYPYTKIIVGGAVLTEAYAKSIGADYYAKDALSALRWAKG
jgi:5-methyltetrahydrofolate--homocysteine methyltransferase